MGKHVNNNILNKYDHLYNKVNENYKGVYLPNERDNYHPHDENLKSTAPNGDVTPLPNPATDPIVCNNIAWMEFDYTDSLADEMKNIEDVKGNHKDIQDKKTK